MEQNSCLNTRETLTLNHLRAARGPLEIRWPAPRLPYLLCTSFRSLANPVYLYRPTLPRACFVFAGYSNLHLISTITTKWLIFQAILASIMSTYKTAFQYFNNDDFWACFNSLLHSTSHYHPANPPHRPAPDMSPLASWCPGYVRLWGYSSDPWFPFHLPLSKATKLE